jgi:acetyl esterase/lipase
MRYRSIILCCLVVLLSLIFLKNSLLFQNKQSTFNRDVTYGHRNGAPLKMKVIMPVKNSNGKGIVWVVSGAWFSSYEAIDVPISQSMTDTLSRRGYTVFAVVHSSQPKFTIPQMLPDLQRAVRFIRYNAADYQIDPNRIGICGASSGGHLALMQGFTGDNGNPGDKDSINRVPSHVQAIACFFPPTDFLNYGESGESGLGRGRLKGYSAPFAFSTNNIKRQLEIGRMISPINHVRNDTPPTLLIHGDRDDIVPIQQSEIMINKLERARVPSRLIRKRGVGHGWPKIDKDMGNIADWFDKYLLNPVQ